MSYISQATLIGDVENIQVIIPDNQIRIIVDTIEEFKKDNVIKNKKSNHYVTIFDKNVIKYINNKIDVGDKVYVEGGLSYRIKDENKLTDIIINNAYGSLKKIDGLKPKRQQPRKNYDGINKYFE